MALQLQSPRFSTQESEAGISPTSKFRNKFGKSGNQGEFSGNFDRAGHHLKSDGTPDMRFKENREEFEGKEEEKEEITPKKQVRFSQREKSQTRQRKDKSRTERKKSDGTPDMRYKENREKFSGKGYENTTSKPTSQFSKANLGLYEGNVPGEHSGKYDSDGHHLKSDGTPDMRFKENREEFSGQGYEGLTKEAKYKHEEFFTDKVYYNRKRPPTPYALYIKENASQMKKDNQDMDMNEVFRELAELWRGMSDKEKKEYYNMYDEEVKRYEESGDTPHHRGSLSMRKLAEKKGLRINTDFGSSKRGKGRKNRNFEQEEEDEENYNPNERIVA